MTAPALLSASPVGSAPLAVNATPLAGVSGSVDELREIQRERHSLGRGLVRDRRDLRRIVDDLNRDLEGCATGAAIPSETVIVTSCTPPSFCSGRP